MILTTKQIKPALLLIILSGFFNFSFAQVSVLKITSDSPDDKIFTEYTLSGKRDTIFVFNGTPSGPANIGNIVVHAVDTALSYIFTWQKFNNTTHLFEDIITDSLTVASDTLKNLDEGGYRVKLTVADSVLIDSIMYYMTVPDSTRAAWILIYNVEPNPHYQNKNNAGIITDNLNNCSNVEFRVAANSDNLVHYDPQNGTSYTKQYVKYSYSLAYAPYDSPADTSTLLGGVSSSAIQTIRLPEILYDTSWFYLEVVDYFGNQLIDTGVYLPVIPYPVIDTSIRGVSTIVKDRFPDDWEGYYVDQSNENQSAPVEVTFYNDSCKNTVEYIWKFGDGTANDTINTKDSVVHVFKVPGKYMTTLIVQGPNPNCIDSVQVEVVVAEVTDTTSFKFPNVFSPDNDGENDVFRCLDISIYDIDIKIYNRWGKLMHKYEGNIRYWQGWNGKIMDSDSDAEIGVYYYILKYSYYNAKGQMIDKERSGFVHLFRGSGGQ